MSTRTRWIAASAAAIALTVAGVTVGEARPATSPAAPPTGSAPAWSYVGPTGPAHWGELGFADCAKGTSQSPINITRSRVRAVADPRFRYGRVELGFTDNGHGVNIAPLPGQRGQTVTLAGARYTLTQFHHHAPSEHQVDGMHFPAEMHFVHAAQNGDLAVFAVPFKGGGATNRAWQPVLDVITRASGEQKVTATVSDLAALLPKDRRSRRYSGSLTTPPCSEGVAWTVFTTPVTLSDRQLTAVLEAYQGNARPVQPLNGRTVLLDRTSGRH